MIVTRRLRLLVPVAAVSVLWNHARAGVQVSSFAQGTDQVSSQVGLISPPSVINSEANANASGSVAPSAGVGALNQSTPQVDSTAGMQTPGFANTQSTAYGSSFGFEGIGASTSLNLGESEYGYAQGTVAKTEGGDPTNLYAQGSAMAATTGGLILSIDVPSTFTIVALATLIGSSSDSLAFYQITSNGPGQVLMADNYAQTSGYNTYQPQASGTLGPGTYELLINSGISPALYLTYLSGGGQEVQSAASSYYSATVDVTPVPIPASFYLLLSGQFGFGVVINLCRRTGR